MNRKFTTSEPFFELQLSCMDRLQPEICLNYKSLFLRSPWHLEAQIWRVIRAKIILGRSEKEKRLVSYVSSYSCLGDDRFFVSPGNFKTMVVRGKVGMKFLEK